MGNTPSSTPTEAAALRNGAPTGMVKRNPKDQCGTPSFVTGLLLSLALVTAAVLATGAGVGCCWMNSFQLQWFNMGLWIGGAAFAVIIETTSGWCACSKQAIAGIPKENTTPQNYKHIKHFVWTFTVSFAFSGWSMYGLRHTTDPALIEALDVCSSAPTVLFTATAAGAGNGLGLVTAWWFTLMMMFVASVVSAGAMMKWIQGEHAPVLLQRVSPADNL